MTKFFLILTTLFTLTINSYSNNEYSADSLDYVRTQVNLYGVGATSAKISYLSPITYAGLNMQYNSDKQKNTRFGIATFNDFYTISLLSHEKSALSIYQLSTDYSYLFHIKTPHISKFNLYAGPSLYFNGSIAYKGDNVNNVFAYKILAYVDFCALARYNFGKKRKLTLTNQFYLSLSALGSTTGYTQIVPDDYTPGVMSSIFSFYIVDSFLALRNKLSFDFQFLKQKPDKTASFWRISYQYSGHSLKASNIWSESNGSLMFGRIFKLYNPR